MQKTFNGKAYITIRDKMHPKEHAVVVNGGTVVMDNITSQKFVNDVSTRTYLGAYKVQLPDKSVFNLIKVDEDERGTFLHFHTNNINAIENLTMFKPNVKFNVYGLGGFTVNYGKFDKPLSRKLPRFFLLMFKGLLLKHQTVDLSLTYN